MFATYILFTKAAIGFWKLLFDLSLPDKNKLNELRCMIRFGVHFRGVLLVSMCLSHLCKAYLLSAMRVSLHARRQSWRVPILSGTKVGGTEL